MVEGAALEIKQEFWKLPLILQRPIVKNSLLSTIKYLLFSPTFLSFFRRRFWGITIRSITQEVEGVALEMR